MLDSIYYRTLKLLKSDYRGQAGARREQALVEVKNGFLGAKTSKFCHILRTVITYNVCHYVMVLNL